MYMPLNTIFNASEALVEAIPTGFMHLCIFGTLYRNPEENVGIFALYYLYL
jgi:hypothetical protein